MKKSPGILFLPHANLQYSLLNPNRREWVVRESYEKIFDITQKLGVKIAFEASGDSIDFMAEKCPDVVAKMKKLIKDGLVEPVASPQTHIMLSNIDAEIGLKSLIYGRETWEKHLGVSPVTGWNPECSWASYIPEIYKEAGFEILIADGDGYFFSTIPGISEETGLKHDVRKHSNKDAIIALAKILKSKPELLLPLFRPNLLENGLKVIFRSDMLSAKFSWALTGETVDENGEYAGDKDVYNTLSEWKDLIPEGNGFLTSYADDAEYVGTTAYFYVKQFGLARFFEPKPESLPRYEGFLKMAVELGYTPMTPSEICKTYEPLHSKGFELMHNGSSWHGGTAKAWTNTAYARLLDPVSRSLFDGLKAIEKRLNIHDADFEIDFKEIMRNIIASYVSDARWPPAPTSPGRFNVVEALDAMEAANKNLEKLMKKHGIAHIKSLYSPDIMGTQIAAIRDELMKMNYFNETLIETE